MKGYDKIEILLIEDNPQDVELITRAFKVHNLDNKIFVVSDGVEALDFIFCTGKYKDRNIQHPPKVILLDLKLPKIDGREVLRRIKEDELTKVIPVVVMTSSQEESDILTTYKLGANSYTVKPVDFGKFIQLMAELGLYWTLINRPPIIK